MDKVTILNKLKENKPVLEEKFDISRIGLFGSYSTNTSTKDSDIDLVYELKDGKRYGLKDVYELEKFFSDLFKIPKIDLINQRYLNPIIEHEIAKTVIYV